MKKYFPIHLLMLVALSLSACTGEGISGTASGSSQKYHVSDEEGSAEGGYNKIMGTYPAEFEISIINDDVVTVEISASVEVGRLRVYLKDPDGAIVDVYIEPGQSGILTGQAAVHFDETFRIYFEAVDGEAHGISYTMNFHY